MKQRDSAAALEAHRRLYTVRDLTEVCLTEARLFLPSRVGMHGMWAGLVGVLLLCLLGYSALGAAWPHLAASWWARAACLVAAGLLCVWHVRRFAYRVQWMLDIPRRQLESVVDGAGPIALNAEHSIGCIAGPYSHGVWSCSIELRHRSLGPVAELFTVQVHALPGATLTQQIVALDDCIDALVRRLGIRRSGGRLAPNPLRESGASAPSFE